MKILCNDDDNKWLVCVYRLSYTNIFVNKNTRSVVWTDKNNTLKYSYKAKKYYLLVDSNWIVQTKKIAVQLLLNLLKNKLITTKNKTILELNGVK